MHDNAPLPRPFFAGLDSSQVHILAHIKRLLERLCGDPDFRREARDTRSGRQRLLDAVGIDLDESDLAPFWRITERGHACLLRNEDLLESPQGRLWVSWLDKIEENRQAALSAFLPTGGERFDSWRRRRIACAASGTSLRLDTQVSPAIVYELSVGCSIQCWFCAFAPPRLQAYLPYTLQNARLWRDLLETARELFGPGCREAVCYHATEPADNPDYLRFLKDFHNICGVYPQTTTAQPLKDIGWTRELLRLRESCPVIPDRFSVLSLPALRRIHEAFTADELKYVYLLLRNKGALTYKVHSGRALAHPARIQAADNYTRMYDPREKVQPQLTIECTSGFLVNLVERSIKLISPCNASDRWPHGVRIHAEGTFHDMSEFRGFVARSIEECMPEHLAQDDRLAFREDLTYQKTNDGFMLTSLFTRHLVKGKPHFARLGDVLAQGNQTAGEVIDDLIRQGVSVFEAISSLDLLYQKGLLRE